MSELITCKDLTKRFGNHTALDHLNLSLASSLRCSLAFFCSMPPSASEAWYPATKF